MRPQDEIDSVLNWAAHGMDEGTGFPGMSYEEGVHAALTWVTGLSDENPKGD
jgi:hypothetical protein